MTTSDGQRLEAELFVSSASAPATMLEMVGRDHLPADYAVRAANPVPSYTVFNVYLGLNRDVFAEQGPAHELFLAGSYSADESWQAGRRGDWGKASLILTDYTRVDPGCAPSGQAVAVVSTEASWDYQDTWGTGGDLTDYHQNPRYLRIKKQVADALIARADAAAPGLADAIEFREASTPLANYRYTGKPCGASRDTRTRRRTRASAGRRRKYHPRPLPRRAWTNTGGQNPAIASGAGAARLAMQLAPTART